MTDSELREQSWNFFQVQAAQRLTTFNFYIALSSLLAGGLAASFKADIQIPLVGVVLGLLLAMFSFVFWKLDQRNRALIKGAEEVLKFFESQARYGDDGGKPHLVKRFLREEFDTKEQKKNKSWCFWRNHYSYTDCFLAVFAAFATIGVAGAIYSIAVNIQRAC